MKISGKKMEERGHYLRSRLNEKFEIYNKKIGFEIRKVLL
jgi:hypothetical protein